jgi:hypothetical protein
MRTFFIRQGRSQQLGTLALLFLTFTAQAAVPRDGGVSGLESQAQAQVSGPVTIARPGMDFSAAIAPLLAAGPLSADTAVRIALLNNPGLQLSLASEGVNISDAVPADSPTRRRGSQEIAVLSAQARKAWMLRMDELEEIPAFQLMSFDEMQELMGDNAFIHAVALAGQAGEGVVKRAKLLETYRGGSA